MGCDAHMYIEYKNKKSKNNYWSSFGRKINPGRNYLMFGLIAEVRCEFPESLKPKGLPENLAYHSSDDNRMYISEEESEGNVYYATAKNWVDRGLSEFIYHNEKPTWVTNPDWHSHTWLTLEEFEKVIELHNKIENSYREAEYEALLAAMKKLEEFENEVRLIVWFDN